MNTDNAVFDPPQLVLFTGTDPAQSGGGGGLPESSPLPVEILSLFEDMTGWVAEFHESGASRRKREKFWSSCQVAGANHSGFSEGADPQLAPQAVGDFCIVDMSERWPAGRPTAHRAKCDRFIKLLGEFAAQSQRTEAELHRALSAVSRIVDGFELDDDLIVDSFVPRHPYQTQSELDGDFELADSVDGALPGDVEPLKNDSNRPAELPTITQHVAASAKWQIGGRRGFYDNRYIDWKLRKDGRIELIAGQIESPESPGDHQPDQADQEWEARLFINPVTMRYWFSVNPRPQFWVFDSHSGKLRPIARLEGVSPLNLGHSLVVTTCRPPAGLNRDYRLMELSESTNADEVATAIQACFGTDEPVLVISCG